MLGFCSYLDGVHVNAQSHLLLQDASCCYSMACFTNRLMHFGYFHHCLLKGFDKSAFGGPICSNASSLDAVVASDTLGFAYQDPEGDFGTSMNCGCGSYSELKLLVADRSSFLFDVDASGQSSTFTARTRSHYGQFVLVHSSYSCQPSNFEQLIVDLVAGSQLCHFIVSGSWSLFSFESYSKSNLTSLDFVLDNYYPPEGIMDYYEQHIS